MCCFPACSTALWRSLTTGCCVCTVGKTSLITRFMYDSFDNTYQVTCVRSMFLAPCSPLPSTGPSFVAHRRDRSRGKDFHACFVFTQRLMSLEPQFVCFVSCCVAVAAVFWTPTEALLVLQATIGIDFLSKTMYLEDRTVRRLHAFVDVHIPSIFLLSF